MCRTLATVTTAVTLMGALLWVDVARATTAQQKWQEKKLEGAADEEHPPLQRPLKARVETQLIGLAVPFIENAGQSDPRVAYYAPTLAGTVFVTRRGEIVHALPSRRDADEGPQPPGWTVTERFVGGRAVPAAAEPSATNVSLFLGDDHARWRAHAPTSAAVSLGEVYAGVTVELKAYGKQVEQVFTVKPGAKVAAIRVRVAGAQGLTVTPDGALAVRTGLGEVRLRQPEAYQEVGTRRHSVVVRYVVAGNTYGFRVAGYDARRPLIIDPVLQATYLGGSGYARAYALALNASTGEVYVAGFTQSGDFPGTSGGAQATSVGSDAFVARLNPSLTALDQATYLAGTGGAFASALAFDANTGELYVAGFTDSSDFPGTSNGAQSTYGGGRDAFVARLNSNLTMLNQATYLGGSDRDEAPALALNTTTGEVYVAGPTTSNDFPGTSGGAQSTFGGGDVFAGDAFVARLNPSLTTLEQATYLGGSLHEYGSALALNATTGEVYVGGYTDSADFPGVSNGAQSTFGGGPYDYADGFVARLNSNLTTLDQATYLGGGGADYVSALALNASTGEVYVAGSTTSVYFPGYVSGFPGTSGGAQSTFGGGDADGGDAFVARLTPSLTALDQATYLGGSRHEFAFTLALNATTGEVYAAGETASADFPGTSNGAQSTPGGGNGDAFVARLNPSLTALDQATYLGGSGNEGAAALALNATTGEVYVAGATTSTDFPATSGGAQSTSSAGSGEDNVFVARLSAELAACPSMPLNTCLNAGRGSVSLKDNPDATKRTVLWKWSKRVTPPAQGDFGDPLNGITSYLLCIYDDTAGVPMLKMNPTVASGQMCGTTPCWMSVKDKGWAYKNKVGNVTGITKVQLKVVGAGRLRIRVQGKGGLLSLPAPVSATKFFNQDPTVIVQLSRTDAPTCWSSTFGTAGTKTNSGIQFRAHAP